jgi:Domain of unknown function (DUF4184)
MPCMILSHQGPVLPLKRWKPRWFSGLGLCLGTVAPDLEFILRLDNDWIVSHTLAAQIYFTVPAVLILYALVVALALPFWLPRLPEGPPWHFDELHALRLPRGLASWARVGVSGLIGGLTHVLLDSVTHGNHSGWLVPHLPLLRVPIAFAGHLPLHDVLQIVLSLGLGVVAWGSWRQMAREGLLWQWLREPRRVEARADEAEARSTLAWFLGWAGVGMALGSTLRPSAGPWVALELGAYGGLAFAALAVMALPSGDRLRRFARRWNAVRAVAAPDEA